MSRRIAIFDTSLESGNLGDVIIMEAIAKVLRDVFEPPTRLEPVPTHVYLSIADYRKVRSCDFGIVGGTNLIASHMLIRGFWRLTPLDILLLHELVLLGVGWRRYERAPDLLSKMFFRRSLSRNYLHSVRDEYTLHKLRPYVEKIVYTGCPTLWSLTPEKCRSIPRTKSRNVVAALNFAHPNPADAELIKLLRRSYDHVYLWCQSQELDRKYAVSLGVCEGLPMIKDVESYNEILGTRAVDVVGSRVHGGIRALQSGCRSLILVVDNRAREMARSSNLPIVDREDLSAIGGWIENSPPVSITLPWDAIDAWKKQFVHREQLPWPG